MGVDHTTIKKARCKNRRFIHPDAVLGANGLLG